MTLTERVIKINWRNKMERIMAIKISRAACVVIMICITIGGALLVYISTVKMGVPKITDADIGYVYKIDSTVAQIIYVKNQQKYIGTIDLSALSSTVNEGMHIVYIDDFSQWIPQVSSEYNLEAIQENEIWAISQNQLPTLFEKVWSVLMLFTSLFFFILLLILGSHLL